MDEWKDEIMVVTSSKVMCTGKPEPRAWEFNGRSGVSYKVNISDGKSNLELPVIDAECWNKFEPFKRMRVDIEISQVAVDNRLSTRCRVIDCKAE